MLGKNSLLRLSNNKGFILVVTYMMIVILFILGTAFFARSFSERKVADVDKQSMIAINIADAGVARATLYIRDTASPTTPFPFGASPVTICAEPSLADCAGTDTAVGTYQVQIIKASAGERYYITVTGMSNNISRVLITTIDATQPAGFYDNAVYSAGDVVLNGNTYAIEGEVTYFSNIDNAHPENITDSDGVILTPTQDDTISPLAMLDFEALYDASALQGNVYTEERLDDVKHNRDSFPSTFCRTGSDFARDGDGEISRDPEGNPISPCEPNFVYIESDLVLNGDVGSIGGFIVVAGDVLNSPAADPNATLNGHGQIDGCIYTRGIFKINGGGGNLNILGGVWAGNEVRLNGNATIEYNLDYMAAIEASNAVDVAFQMIAWREQYQPF